MEYLHQLEIGQTKELEIHAKEKWSSHRVVTSQGQKYRIWCEGKQQWKDSFFNSSPDGFFNLLAYIAGQRVKGVKCFCLCGAYNEDISTGFAIGSLKEFDVMVSGQLSFFPNDTSWAYGNNKGKIKINVLRIQ
jgi:hypothetical protein